MIFVICKIFYTISNFFKFTLRIREYCLEVGYDELRRNVELIRGGGGGGVAELHRIASSRGSGMNPHR